MDSSTVCGSLDVYDVVRNMRIVDAGLRRYARQVAVLLVRFVPPGFISMPFPETLKRLLARLL